MSKKLEQSLTETHRVIMPTDKALEYLTALKDYANAKLPDPCFAIALSMAIDCMNRAETAVTEPLTLERFEEICEAVHNGWWQEKVNQGVTDHPDMKPYADLAEATKDYDRATVCRVLDALGIAYRQPEGGEG